MKKIFVVSLAIFLFASQYSSAQIKKDISLEDIWVKGVFHGESFEGFKWMKNDEYYTKYEDGNIVRYSISSGARDILIAQSDLKKKEEFSSVEFEDYEFNEKENKILLTFDTEPIYRRSSRSYYCVYDLSSQNITLIPEAKQKISYATFSPDGSKVAYVRNNNLFYYDLTSNKESQLTSDGIFNKIINGSTDWVYEEEFEFARAFFWSGDSKKIAFYTFDESQVREYNMQLWTGLYPEDYKFKYPKAGEKNSEVYIKVYDFDSKKMISINTGEEKNNYIPRIKWTKDPNLLSIQRLNRKQNHLEVLHANVNSGKVETAYEEKNNTYIEINDDLTYLNDGQHFILTSENDGFRHIYLYSMSGKLISQVTKGNWEVDKFLGVDEIQKLFYYTSTEVSPMERHLYTVGFSGKKKSKLTIQPGSHEIELSTGYKYFIDNFSTANTPNEINLNYLSSGKLFKPLLQNLKLKSALDLYKISPVEFFQFKNDEANVSLNASLIKPAGFDASKKYPVFIFIYGGPGSQNVKSGWNGANYFWFQMLAQKGYLVVTIDNRGTGGRGAAFKKMTQNKLGKYETEDLIAAAKYLGTQPYVDKGRIGIFGWSFGGYMASLAMTVGADYFKAGIAVAPVISWRFYDTIYTERFLGEPEENPSGYDDNSPLSHAQKLKGKFLLIHGTADDNVHLQNSMAMEDALIRANKQFDAFYYPNKNHGIYGGTTRYHLYKKMTDFIEENL